MRRKEIVRVAGVTVLYHAEEDIILNIQSYINQIELLYIVANSDSEPIEDIKNSFPTSKIIFLENHKNVGIATALNQAIDHSISNGFDFILMMDQDSKVSNLLVELMLKEFEADEMIGILAPFIIHEKNPKLPSDKIKEELQIAITSGSIVKLSLIDEVGKFLDKLFIDYVDFEFSLRVISKGYKIIQINNAFVFHKLGDITQNYFFGKKIFPTNHSPMRCYYRTRNRFYIYKLYQNLFPDFVRDDKKNFLNDLIKILFFERKKIYKFYMILKGFYHYKKNIFGYIKVT
jgi:rhamnosyltransferase